MEEDQTLEVTDRRRVHMNGEEAPDSATEAPMDTPGAAAAPEGAAGSEAEEDASMPFPPMDVYALLKTTIGLLSNGAWAWMGLSPSPFSGQMEKDLAQAKVAIDTVALLVNQVDPHLTDEERRDLRNTVSMLRVNFVQQSTP